MFKRKKKLCKMQFSKDENGKDVLLKDGSYQVMMEWEKPYMEACIDALEPFGDVLEIGFGCGYSATHIQKYKPRTHTIIEYHPVVCKKAREWAKNHPGVKIVEDTWQNALSSLGVFDCIFFDDYPLESPKETEFFQKAGEKASLVLSKGQKLIKSVQEKFTFLKTMQYKDDDLDYFFTHLKNKQSVDKAHYLPFFFDLKKKGNITEEQFSKVMERLFKEEMITLEIKQAFFEKVKLQEESNKQVSHRSDRFFEFLKLCVASHMREGSRLSCYLDNPASKYEDDLFFNEVITNPNLDYKEKEIEVDVPSNCRYYHHKHALVAVITKMG